MTESEQRAENERKFAETLAGVEMTWDKQTADLRRSDAKRERAQCNEAIVLMRCHSGCPAVHYKIRASDPRLAEWMAHCGIVGTAQQALACVLGGHSFRGLEGGGYWLCRGSKDQHRGLWRRPHDMTNNPIEPLGRRRSFPSRSALNSRPTTRSPSGCSTAGAE